MAEHLKILCKLFTMTKPKAPTQNGNFTLNQKAQIVKYTEQLSIKERNNVVIAHWAFKTFKLRVPPHPTTIGRICEVPVSCMRV